MIIFPDGTRASGSGTGSGTAAGAGTESMASGQPPRPRRPDISGVRAYLEGSV
jgi:hypothetical protein